VPLPAVSEGGQLVSVSVGELGMGREEGGVEEGVDCPSVITVSCCPS
jgi:hypothetical protein